MKKDYDNLLNTYIRYADDFDLNNDNFAGFNIFLLSYSLLRGNIIKYDDFLKLFEKLLNKSIEFYNTHSSNEVLTLYKNVNYSTDLLKLLLDRKTQSDNILDDSFKLKAVKPIINKMNISFTLFSSSLNDLIDNLDNGSICIEYEIASPYIIIKNKSLYGDGESIYGKRAKFLTEEDKINYEPLLSIFGCNSASHRNDFISISNNNIKIKSIYFPKTFDDSNIEIIKKIIDDKNIKLCRLDN